jgi:hypothetical protein
VETVEKVSEPLFFKRFLKRKVVENLWKTGVVIHRPLIFMEFSTVANGFFYHNPQCFPQKIGGFPQIFGRSLTFLL